MIAAALIGYIIGSVIVYQLLKMVNRPSDKPSINYEYLRVKHEAEDKMAEMLHEIKEGEKEREHARKVKSLLFKIPPQLIEHFYKNGDMSYEEYYKFWLDNTGEYKPKLKKR